MENKEKETSFDGRKVSATQDVDYEAELHRIKGWMREACETAKMEVVAWSIEVKWSPMRSPVAKAKWPARVVRFSKPIWPFLRPEQRRNVVFHEVCHILARFDNQERIKPHGPEWRGIMAMCNEPATVVIEIDAYEDEV